MQVIRHDLTEPPRNEAPIFTGEVHMRQLVGEGQSGETRVLLVKFAAGGRNVLHRHTFDQVLYVTEGEGIVANAAEQVTVRAGDIVVIPAGEPHWHGATETTPMSHLAISRPGETEIVR